MTTSSTATTHPIPRTYRSPPHALVWFFRKSRDNWKHKYLDVKAQLRRAHRRLDRLAKAKRSFPAPCATSSKPVAAVSAPPSCLAALHQAMLDLRQQVQANRELLEHGQQQNLEILHLARQIQQLAADTPAPAPPPKVQAPQLRSTLSHQAPPEPKKGAPRQHNR
jgi:hypothetical protein